MVKPLNVMMVLIISSSSGLLLLGSACGISTTTKATVMQTSEMQPQTTEYQAIVPYIPPSYYSCSVTTPFNLGRAYFGRYNNIAYAEMEFNNQVFVFQNMVINESELKYATDEYLWLDGIIQCYFLSSGSARQLKVGEIVDVVGIDAGVCKDYKSLLVFTGCIFLPAGSVQLPAAGTSSLVIPSY